MAVSNKSFLRASLAISALVLVAQANAQSAPSVVPVPFLQSIAGTGTAGVTTCTTGIPTTGGTSFGDGCAAATAGLAAPQGAAVDKYGNVYIADYTDRLVRVIYNGGSTLAAAITAANSGYSISASAKAPAPTPVAGDMYTLAGFGGTAVGALNVTASDGKYSCANYAASGQPEALNSLGDGCPAASAPIGPRDVSVDTDGNLFLTDYTNSRIRVLCVNCYSTALATQLIELEEPGVTPVNGAMYTIAGFAGGYRDGYIGFGNAASAATSVALLRSPTAAVVSGSDDVYIADNLNNAVRLLYNGGTAAKNILAAQGITPTQGYVYTIAGAGCVSAATTKTGSVTSANSCLTTTGSDTPTLGNALGLSVAWTVYLDANNNVFYTDAGNARIKVIYGGVAPPLTFPNSAYPSLATGYSYSFAGQGTLTQSGVAPSQLVLVSAQSVGGDQNGNIFFVDYSTGLFYETYAATGLTAVIGGGNAIATATAGASCNGANSGPSLTDAYYDGCPLTQTKIASPRGPIVADSAGNLYFGDSPGSLLRKFTYNPLFPATNVGSTSTAQPYAFSFLSSQRLAANSILAAGATTTVFADAGGDTCIAGLTASGGGPGATCVVNLVFSPSQPGIVDGALELTSASGVLGSVLLSGQGKGPGLTVDPGTLTSVGSGLVLKGIAVDGSGRVIVADAASKSILRYSGGTPSTLATGFSAPSGVAIDGAGDLFVADSAANSITEFPVTGAKFTLSSAVNNPHGIATDNFGNLYVADTGNNRVLILGPGSAPNSSAAVVAGFTGLSAPQAVAVDANGNLYAADSSHIVELTPSGAQTTVASLAGTTGLAVDAAGDVLATTATMLVEFPAANPAETTLSSSLVSASALALDSSGNAYIADSGQAGYISIQRTAGFYKFTSYPANAAVTLTSEGNVALSATTFSQTDTTDFSLAPSTTNGCSGALASGNVCALTAGFNPTLPGTLTDTVTFSAPTTNASPVTLALTGTTTAQNTTTALKISASSIVYGAVETLTATVSASLSAPSSGSVNFYNGATLLGSASIASGGVAAFSFVPPAGSYSVTATFVPSGLGFYGSTTASAMPFSVTPALLTVTANNASKLVNAANPTLTYTITGFVNNDTQSTATLGVPAESTTATTSSSVGTYPITITQGTLTAVNYTFSFVNGTLTITGATPQSITFGALPGVTYGAAPITLVASASSGLAVSYSVTGPASINGSVLKITGAGLIAVTATQTGNNTYAAAPPVTQSFTSSPAVLNVAAGNASRTYGSANPTLTYAITGFVNGDSQVTSTTGTPAESTTAGITSSVNTYPITVTQGTLASNNYTFTFTNGTLTVTPATLTLAANSASRVYGTANPTFTGSISGVLNNDPLVETFSTTATAASSPGTYSIVPGVSGTNAGNYTLAATNGVLTITAATPIELLSASPTSGYNGATNITLTATLSSPTTGTPTGTVTFLAGTVTVGSAPVSGGTAVLTTNALPVGSDAVTAVYSGDANFNAVTSSPVLLTIAAGFSVTPSSTTLSFQSGYQEAQAIFSINPGGRTDTLTFACQGLPSKLNCAFSPTSLSLNGVTAVQTVQLLVSNSSATASIAPPPSRWHLALAMLPLVFVLGRRRRLRLLLSACVATIALGALAGCGSSPTALEQSGGTYTFSATVNSGSTTLQTINFTLTIP